METTTHKVPRPVTQPWGDDEIGLLEELAHESPSRAELIRLFPNRSADAVKQQLFKVRRRLGIDKKQQRHENLRRDHHTMLDPGDPGERDYWLPAFRARAEQSNARYLEALMAA